MDERVMRNQLLSLRYDWYRKLERYLGVLPWDVAGVSAGLSQFQREHGLAVTGVMTAETRLKWIEHYPAFGIQLLGLHLTPGRVLLDASNTDRQSEARGIERIWRWNQTCDGYVPREALSVCIWAIRGVVNDGKGRWIQTDSAKRFSQEPYGLREHFSSAKLKYADTCFILLWHDEAGVGHLRTFEGTCNPGSIWPHGTAHLCSGQYFYKLGRHRTREMDHIDSVLRCSSEWPAHWVTDRTSDSVQYYALEGVSPIEVVRSTGDSLDISSEDIRRAEVAIAHRDAVYVDQNRIKINIHTCAEGHASSLGCMNILPDQYAEFMSILENLAICQQNVYGFALDIPFYLCDASMLD